MRDRRNVLTLERLHNAISGAENKLVVLYFCAKWSRCCKIMDDLLPYIEEHKNPPPVTMFKIDVQRAQDVCLKFKITSVPTFFILVNGQLVDRIERKYPVELWRRLKELQAFDEMLPRVAREDQIPGAHQ